jgi:dipeptidase D
MDQQIPGLVETSNNLGVLTMEGATASIECFTRSSVTPAMHAVVEAIRAAARLGGAEFSIVPPEGPCWEVDPSSRLLAEARAAYRRLFGADPRLLAVHGFLECALIKKQISDLDIVSIGPEIRDAHKPGERVHIESVDRFHRLISEVLRALAIPASSQAPHPGSA